MKKTLFALLALLTLSGVSVAKTDTSAIDTTDPKLVSFFDFEESNAQTAGKSSSAGLWNELLVQTTSDEVGSYGTLSQGHRMYASNPGFTNVGTGEGAGFTISFDLNAATLQEGSSSGVLLHINSNSGGNSGAPWRHVGLYLNSDNKVVLCFKPATIGNEAGELTEIEVNGSASYDWSTITIVSNSPKVGGDGCNLQLYINGELQGTIDMSQATNWGGEAIGGIQFGQEWGGGNAVDPDGSIHNPIASAQLDNILIYDKALTAEQVRNLVLVPEPATATLSLLALAGLLARRRRK